MIRRILTARVDLLYNGGIGTYVKASSGGRRRRRRPRQRPRARGRQASVRARVVGEGGNLGFTQKGAPRVLGAGGLAQHRRRRQLRRRRHLRPRGEHQDPDGPAREEGRRQGPRRAQPHPGGDDRGGGARWCSPTTRARRWRLTLDGLRSAPPLRGVRRPRRRPGGGGRAEPRATTPIPTREELLASPQRERGLPRPLLARAARPHEDVGVPDGAWRRTSRTARPAGRSSTPTSRACCASASPSTSRSTRCGARSSPPAAVNHLVNRGGVAAAAGARAGCQERDRRGGGRLDRGRPRGARRRRCARPCSPPGGRRRGAGGAPRDRGRARGRGPRRLEGKKKSGQPAKRSARSESGWACDGSPPPRHGRRPVRGVPVIGRGRAAFRDALVPARRAGARQQHLGLEPRGGGVHGRARARQRPRGAARGPRGRPLVLFARLEAGGAVLSLLLRWRCRALTAPARARRSRASSTSRC